jgi:hypothetical protein
MGAIIALSNYLVQFQLGDWLTLAAFTYPIAFLVTDLALRLLGSSVAKRVVLVGFAIGIGASLLGAFFDVTTLRIAIASALAFLIAQLVDINIFTRLRALKWWQAPAISSTLGSIIDTFIFFSVAFGATTFALMPDANTWAQDVVPLLGVGPALPLFVSLATADLAVKLLMVLVLLLPYRLALNTWSKQSN